MAVNAKIVLLPGDGIGPEIIDQGERVLQCIAERFGHQFEFTRYPMGGNAIDSHGTPLPDETLAACRDAEAILLGAVGGPKWDDPNAKTRPEAGLLALRKELKLFANLRPIKPCSQLIDASPLKREIVEGVDILFLRELTGGIYFGGSELKPHPSGEEASSVMTYHTEEIARIVRLAAKAAQLRRGKLTSVDKANVLEVSQLWRSVIDSLAQDYPDVAVRHMYVDNCAMQLVGDPGQFDVVVTGNMFGDILSDISGALTGSLGMLPSASLGQATALYEPIHGSAPDIAGTGRANPLAAILSIAMLLEHSAKRPDLAASVERAVDAALESGLRTGELASGQETEVVGTAQMGDAVIEHLSQALASGGR